MKTEAAVRAPRSTQIGARWAAFVWRLPTGSSTPRVTIWRQLRRLGAAALTPGAALLPWLEETVEQLDWLAQEVDDQGGDAWVLQVNDLSEADVERVISAVNADRSAEYAELRRDAQAFALRAQGQAGGTSDPSRRLAMDRELVALQRRFRKVRARDHFGAAGRREAAHTIDGCLRFRQGISSKLTPTTDQDHADSR